MYGPIFYFFLFYCLLHPATTATTATATTTATTATTAAIDILINTYYADLHYIGPLPNEKIEWVYYTKKAFPPVTNSPKDLDI